MLKEGVLAEIKFGRTEVAEEKFLLFGLGREFCVDFAVKLIEVVLRGVGQRAPLAGRPG